MENRNCHNFRKYPYNYRMALRIFNEPMAFILRQKPNQQHRCIKMSRRLCVASVAVALVTQQSGVYPKFQKQKHPTSLRFRGAFGARGSGRRRLCECAGGLLFVVVVAASDRLRVHFVEHHLMESARLPPVRPTHHCEVESDQLRQCVENVRAVALQSTDTVQYTNCPFVH